MLLPAYVLISYFAQLIVTCPLARFAQAWKGLPVGAGWPDGPEPNPPQPVGAIVGMAPFSNQAVSLGRMQTWPRHEGTYCLLSSLLWLRTAQMDCQCRLVERPSRIHYRSLANPYVSVCALQSLPSFRIILTTSGLREARSATTTKACWETLAGGCRE